MAKECVYGVWISENYLYVIKSGGGYLIPKQEIKDVRLESSRNGALLYIDKQTESVVMRNVSGKELKKTKVAIHEWWTE